MRIGQIVRGERSITADTAIQLGLAFNTTPRFWMTPQVRYDLEVAELRVDAGAIDPLVA